MHKAKIKVGVLMGGMSLEREVSFNSGRTICDHLNSDFYEIIPIFQTLKNNLYILPWKFLHRGKISDFEDRLENEAEKVSWKNIKEKIDFMYLSVHGQYAEDGSIQGILEFLKIPYSGSNVLTSAISSSKFFHEKILKMNGINVPNSILIKDPLIEKEKIEKFIESFKLPLILKPSDEGSSLGVKIINSFEEILLGIEEINLIFKENKNFKKKFLLEELIKGSEFSCVLIEKEKDKWEAFEPTEIVHKNENYIFNYNDKYMRGASIKYTPARFSKENIDKIKETCLKVISILKPKSIIRIDGFLNEKNEIFIIESNIFPGTAQSSFTFVQASLNGYSHSDLINLLIRKSLENSSEKFLFNEFKIRENKMEKKNIAVVFGGASAEKETSLDSGRNVFYKISREKYNVDSLFLNDKNEFFKINSNQVVKDSTHEISSSLKEDQKIEVEDLKKYDFVFLALHGDKGENGTIQGLLKSLKIPHNGSGILASGICMDKHLTLSLLKQEGFQVTNNFLLNKSLYKNFLNEEDFHNFFEKKNLKFPLITKPSDDGCSFKVNVCKTKEDLISSINDIFISKENILIEEFIDAMELTVGVIGNDEIEVLPPTYVPKKSDILSLEEKFLPGEGENITPAPLKFEQIEFIKKTIKEIYSFLECKGYARIDCFFIPSEKSKKNIDELIILEINTLPALTPATCLFHQASEIGLKPTELINKIIDLGFEEN